MDKNEVNTLIVGAGPSGLLNAIGLLHKNPGKKVLILEKRETYSRNHVVRFNHKKLEEYIKAIGGENIPELMNLYRRMKKSSAIRIRELEEALREIAKKAGAEIDYTEVTEETDIYNEYPNLEVLLGCDGTHSVISDKMFGKENQQKHEFDYVLQVRFEVSGQTPDKVDLPTWPAYLQAYGLAGEEIIGKTVDGKTPITMQIMIPKEDFDALKPYALSKDPIRPFHDGETKLEQVPPGVMKKVKGYLGFRLAHYTKHNTGESIDMSDVRLSVNEAPATRAQKVVKFDQLEDGREVCVMLSGDAALGLSYFKGVDAGLENMSKSLTALNTESASERRKKLDEYQAWFDEDLAPRKINEVAFYSKYIARSTEYVTSFFNRLLGRDFILNTAQAERFADLYHVSQRDGADKESFTSPYLHRRNYFYPILTSTPVPLSEYGNDIKSHFKNFFGAYKSNQYLYRDLLQPFNALRHILVGAAKLILSPLASVIYVPLSLGGFLFTVAVNLSKMSEFKMHWQQVKSSLVSSFGRMVDGTAEIGLGLMLGVTSLLMPLKVATNLVLTKKSPTRTIETNPGMSRLLNEAEKAENDELSINQMHALLIDVHRKFEKSVQKGQATRVSPEAESKAYEACKLKKTETYKEYFRLFRENSKNQSANDDLSSVLDEADSFGGDADDDSNNLIEMRYQ
ncbi:hypothetical protein B1207_11565 [Legionella quinlivanii]|uniref:FAD-binding domain-containing protein n=1 Tax=Legionella quinlivanii TaxID=45073 RepID=A0A364LHG1_9GAMM|nr:hypothetical protein [Legionella quinlivanii]RAP35718.1 hypothetical protein B1207_11565 [Legionella quinlivanii]